MMLASRVMSCIHNATARKTHPEDPREGALPVGDQVQGRIGQLGEDLAQDREAGVDAHALFAHLAVGFYLGLLQLLAPCSTRMK